MVGRLTSNCASNGSSVSAFVSQTLVLITRQTMPFIGIAADFIFLNGFEDSVDCFADAIRCCVLLQFFYCNFQEIDAVYYAMNVLIGLGNADGVSPDAAAQIQYAKLTVRLKKRQNIQYRPNRFFISGYLKIVS